MTAPGRTRRALLDAYPRARTVRRLCSPDAALDEVSVHRRHRKLSEQSATIRYNAYALYLRRLRRRSRNFVGVAGARVVCIYLNDILY